MLAAIADGELAERRLASLRKLDREVEGAEARPEPTGASGRSVRARAADRAYRRGDDDD